MRSVLFAFVISLAVSASASAQETRGKILGTVQDAQGVRADVLAGDAVGVSGDDARWHRSGCAAAFRHGAPGAEFLPAIGSRRPR